MQCVGACPITYTPFLCHGALRYLLNKRYVELPQRVCLQGTQETAGAMISHLASKLACNTWLSTALPPDRLLCCLPHQ